MWKKTLLDSTPPWITLSSGEWRERFGAMGTVLYSLLNEELRSYQEFSNHILVHPFENGMCCWPLQSHLAYQYLYIARLPYDGCTIYLAIFMGFARKNMKKQSIVGYLHFRTPPIRNYGSRLLFWRLCRWIRDLNTWQYMKTMVAMCGLYHQSRHDLSIGACVSAAFQDAFALTSPFWQTLRKAIALWQNDPIQNIRMGQAIPV